MNLFDKAERNFDAVRDAFEWRIPQRFNMAHWVCDRHAARGDQTAIHYETPAGDEIAYSYARLYELSNRFANALQGLGVSAGDRVAVILPQRPETAIAHIAVYKLAAIALPLATLFGPDALAYRLSDSEAKLVVTDAEHAAVVAELKSELPALETIIQCDGPADGLDFWRLLERASDVFHTAHTNADDPALLIYTSGTTGPPKGALVAHRCLLGNLPGFELSQNFFPQSADVFWTPADWAWTGGLLDGLMPTLYYARPILADPGRKFDPERAFHLCQKYRISNAFIPPTALKMMRQVPDIAGRYSLELRAVMSAGEQVGAALIHWGRECLQTDINEMWGQTEFNYLVGNCAPILEPRPGSMGKAYPGHEVAVIDPEGQPMAVGETGELAARSGDPVMFLGYWNNEQATQEKLIGEWFCTGDVGYRDADGYLWFVGRKDDVISSAGYRIGPGEVEDCLLKHPAVVQAAVIGSPDELRGAIVKAFIVLAEGCEPSEGLASEIQRSVRDRLSAHEYPRAVEFIDALPMTTTGKVRRIELRERELARQPNPAESLRS